MAVVGEFHVGDIGTKITFTVKDQTGPTTQVVVVIGVSDTHTVTFRRPDKTTFTKSTVREGDGSAGQVSYTTVDATILNQGGHWSAQVELVVTSPSQTHKSEVVEFVVHDNL
jgi:hypothetical protein